MTTLKDEWTDYRRKVIPAEAPSVSVNNCRFAFYAGCAVMFELLTALGDLPEREAEQRIAAIEKEMRAFAAEQGCAPGTRES